VCVDLEDKLAGDFWQGRCTGNGLRRTSAFKGYEGRTTGSRGLVHVSNRSSHRMTWQTDVDKPFLRNFNSIFGVRRRGMTYLSTITCYGFQKDREFQNAVF
jgi:hypothetical protein